MNRSTAAAAAALMCLTAAPAHAGDYTVDLSRSQLYVQVFKDPTTTAAALSHNHVMRAVGWSGTLSYDPDSLACNLSISIPVSKLAVDEPKMRDQVGYESNISEDQRGDVRKNMLSDSQLNASAHPNITFQASQCDGSKITGQMTIRGKSKTVTADYTISGDKFIINDRVKIRATDFGFEPYSALFGQLKNRNEMTVVVRLIADPS